MAVSLLLAGALLLSACASGPPTFTAPRAIVDLSPGVVRTEIWNAGRNRQEQFGGAQQSPEEFRNFVAEGMDPDEVGRITVAGIRRGDFYILSPPEIRPIVEARYQELLAAFDKQS